jgi:hypothetical protein
MQNKDKSEDETSYQSANGPEAVSESVNRVKGIEKPAPPEEEGATSEEDTPSEGLNPYQPEEFWVDLNKVHAAGAVRRRITAIRVGRPPKHAFFRTHPAAEYWKSVNLVEYERETYLLHPRMVAHLDEADYYQAILTLGITRSGALFFWPLKLSSENRSNEWNDSALNIAKRATTTWLKLRSRPADGFYDADEPLVQFDDPVWPDKTPKQLYDIGFRGRIIDSLDHLIVQKLFGQIK